MRTIAYDVIGVNVFLPTLMRILPKKEDNSVPPILLSKMWYLKNMNVYESHKERIVSKNALTTATGLACLEIRSRHEEAINSTRNMIYSLQVFYFLLYRRRYFLFLSELI